MRALGGKTQCLEKVLGGIGDVGWVRVHNGLSVPVDWGAMCAHRIWKPLGVELRALCHDPTYSHTIP